MSKFLPGLFVSGLLVLCTAASAQNDFDDCNLLGPPNFQLLQGDGGSMLFRDADLVMDNQCTQNPGDYEHYVDGIVQPPGNFVFQSRAQVDPGSDFEVNFNYRPYLNNNSHFQMLVNTNSEMGFSPRRYGLRENP